MASRGEQVELDPIAALVRDVQKLKRELRELRASRRLESATIGKGGLVVKDDGQVIVLGQDGQPVVTLGRVHVGGVSRDGMAVFRPDGSPSLAGWDGVPVTWDQQGNIVVSTDEASGEGLARPWLPTPMYPSGLSGYQATTASSYATLWEGTHIRQHHWLYAAGLVQSDADTTGQVRVIVAGTQVGTAVSVPTNSWMYWNTGKIACPGAFGDNLPIEIQARRSGGTGQIRVAPVQVMGLQS